VDQLPFDGGEEVAGRLLRDPGQHPLTDPSDHPTDHRVGVVGDGGAVGVLVEAHDGVGADRPRRPGALGGEPVPGRRLLVEHLDGAAVGALHARDPRVDGRRVGVRAGDLE
jgi:hypothetical protein